VGEEEEIPEEVKELVAPNETILYVAKQKGSKFKPDLKKRIFPDMIILTDRRIIHIHPRGLIRGAIGMRDYTDYPYEDMRNIELKRGAFRATLKITPKTLLEGGKMPEIKDIYKHEAEDMFGIVREILMKKEKEPKVTPTVISPQPAQETLSPLEQLEKLAKLKEAGIITKEEFEEKKKELLKKI
jgi:hypothetical protein